jgi:hypothetical protein
MRVMDNAVVWLERDLRLRDHAPLHAAQSARAAAALYVIEPAWLASPEFSPSHLQFTLQCLAVQQRHGSRKSGLPPSGRASGGARATRESSAPKRPSPQGELF